MTEDAENATKTCWILNSGNLTTHVHNPDAVNPSTNEVGLGFKLRPGEFIEIDGSVRTWRARLKGIAHLSVTAAAPDPDQPVQLASVMPKPVATRGPQRNNRKSREEIDAA